MNIIRTRSFYKNEAGAIAPAEMIVRLKLKKAEPVPLLKITVIQLNFLLEK